MNLVKLLQCAQFQHERKTRKLEGCVALTHQIRYIRALLSPPYYG